MAMRLVRFDTGRADDARQASSAGWNAIATGSSSPPAGDGDGQRRAQHDGGVEVEHGHRDGAHQPHARSTGGGRRPGGRRRRRRRARREARRAGRRAGGRRWARPGAGRRPTRRPAPARRSPASARRPPTGKTHAGSRHGRAIEPETPTTRRVTATAATPVDDPGSGALSRGRCRAAGLAGPGSRTWGGTRAAPPARCRAGCGPARRPTTSSSSRASGAPTQKWMPPPKPMWAASPRPASKRSGSGKRRGSRLAEPNSIATSSPTASGWPAISTPSSSTQRSNSCSGASHRIISSTATRAGTSPAGDAAATRRDGAGTPACRCRGC